MKTYPLTQTQLGMFLEWNEARESTRYTLAFVHVFPKTIDAERFVRAVEESVAAHDVFRARFVDVDGEIRWTVDETIAIRVVRSTASDAEADRHQKSFVRGFDAFKGPFARFELVETPTTFRLFTEIFHMISDGTGVKNFMAEIQSRYGEEGKGKSGEGKTFADYVEEERAGFESKEYAEAREAALARFAGRAMTVPEASEKWKVESGKWEVGSGKGEGGSLEGDFLSVETEIPRGKIDDYCRGNGIHPNLFFLGVFARTLALFANEKDVVFWTVNHGRGKGGRWKDCFGCCVKLVPVFGELKREESCADYFRSFMLHGAGVYPFTHFCRELGVKPGWGLIYQDGTVDFSLTLDGIRSATITPMSGGAGEMPGVQVFGADGEFRLEMTCEPGRYDRPFLTEFLSRMKIIAENFTATDAARPLKDVCLLTDEERAAVMKTSYGGDLEYDASKTFVDLFREQVAAHPDAIAVVGHGASEASECPTVRMTYGELDERSSALASVLFERGVEQGGFVAVKLPRCVEFIIAVLAVQKCGAGYVPLDPEYPQDRLDYMISDSGAPLVIDAEMFNAQPSTLNPQHSTLNTQPSTPALPAYMIYTSGSTGRPKGVVVPHRALRNVIAWVIRDYGLTASDRVASHPSFSFDASVIDIFPTLAAGAELHIFADSIRKDLPALGDYIVKNGITCCTMSTQIGMALLNSYPDIPLRHLQLGGEKLMPVAKTDVKIINGYGPTEFCVCSSYHVVDQSKNYDIPIGRAVPNTSSFIVDRLGALVPPGMPGEIALAGVQLSDGYWHQPEKTEKAFVDGRYLTGDLGKYNAEGQLEFLGRLDFQVKLRGFRIEIGEIEHVASSFPGVGGVIALVKKIAGVEHLVLYYEQGKAEKEKVKSEELRSFLSSKLTPYMVPDYFVAMEKLPLTPGGKIDRAALPLPKTDDEPVVAPSTDVEAKLLHCLKAVLRREDIGVTHDLNHLGLTSIGAMEFVVRVKKALDAKVTLRQLADHPNVRDLASVLRTSSADTSTQTLKHSNTQTIAPMTENQRGIYVDWLRNPGTTQYNIAGAVRFPEMDPGRLADAAEKVFAAHASFRIHFAEREGEIVQEIDAGSRVRVEVERLDSEPDASFFASRVKPFSPQDACLTRAKVFCFDSNTQTPKHPNTQTTQTFLFLDVHHTVFDGVSMGIFIRDLMRVLDGGEPVGEDYSLMDAAREERKYLEGSECEEDEKWFERYLDAVESTRLEESPHLVAVEGTGNYARVCRALPAAEVVKTCSALGVTPSDYLLTAFTELLRRIGRSEDVLINFVSAGRTDPATAGTTGMFVKTLPLRGIKGVDTFAEAVSRMHLSVLDLLDRERVSFAHLAERCGVRADVLFAFEGGIFELPHGASLIEVPLDTAKAPLSVVVNPGKDSFAISFEYDRTLYSAEDMERLLAMYVTLAENATKEGVRLRDIPLVAEEEAKKILALSYGGDLAYDETKTFLDLFRANVITRSFATAVVGCRLAPAVGHGASEASECPTVRMTYGELDEQSSALAKILIERGVEPGGFVAVKLPRCVEFVVAVLAVQKCGAGYIPVDPEYPQDRIDYIVSDSGAALVIDAEMFNAQPSPSHLPAFSPSHPLTFSPPALPAYMIYTSGSTGRPKGVVVPHRALRNLVAWVIRDYGLKPSDHIATHASFSFDASVIDIFPALAAGAELHIYGDAIRKDLPAIRDYIVKNGITGGTMSTQIGMALLDSYPDLPLRYLQLGGEKLMPVAKTNVKIVNGYGPTEFCVCSSYEFVDQNREGDIPIGRPVANTWSLIVDRYGHLLPLGCAGELALMGPQIADGYWHQPEKTEKVFVGGRYRTGDLCRYNAEQKLEYLGRLDFQVKLRGFRIEIGEIESVAKQFPGIGAVAAEVREVGGAKHLVLYYENGKSIREDGNSEELKSFLSSKLTSYMVPDYFVEVGKMPMTPNGKIDRRKLKSPSAADAPREYVEPANETERLIAKCYGEVLKLERFGATDDFFDLGGTSIVAIQAVVKLQKAGLDVPYGDVFKYKTPRSLAAFLFPNAQPSQPTQPSQRSPYADYDYAAIDALLKGTRRELFEGFERPPLGTVLLTGGTGYLGMHVLRYLLEKTDSTVCVLVRAKKGVGPARRIDSQYVYYFGERVPKRHLERLVFVEGDITDSDLATRIPLSTFHFPLSTLINCAALVKHYVADDLMDRINVGGVENLIRFCGQTGARLVHVSTYSVGGTIRADSVAGLDERHLYIGQESDNDYVRTKFLAERAILAAIAAGGLRGKIMRLGNLMGRESDGEFQMNVGANAFVNSLRSYRALGAYPLEDLAKPLEMSPIDRVAEAIVLLATTPDDMYVFHPYNRYALDMGAVVAAMNARGLDIDAVSRDEFAAHVDALRNDPARAKELQGILHYAGHLLENRKMAPVDNTWTTTVLYRLGFRWKPAEDGYLANFFTMLNGMGVFE